MFEWVSFSVFCLTIIALVWDLSVMWREGNARIRRQKVIEQLKGELFVRQSSK